MENNFNIDAYNKYFGVENTTIKEDNNIISNLDYPDQDIDRGNIGDIDTLAELLRLILNAAWGDDWGEFGPELKRGEDPDDIKFPQITYDINSREVTEKMPIKPILTGTVREIVENKETGDAFQVYRQWFDCIVEFNIWGTNTLQTNTVTNNFEAILSSYAGYLKKKGISEMFFLKEVSSRQSDKYIEGMPMKTIMYFFRIEKIQTIRVSTLEKIDYAVKLYENQNRVTNSFNIQNNKITYDL